MKLFQLRFALLLAALAIAAPTPSEAKPSATSPQICGYVFKEGTEYDLGLPNPDYDFMSKVDRSKSTILDDIEVFDQRSYGCCWITEPMGKICRACAALGKNIRPVDTYLAAISIAERALKAPLKRNFVVQGGNTPYAISLINRYGIIPEGALVQTKDGLKPWKPIVDFQKGKNGDRLIEGVNLRLATYYEKTNDAYAEMLKAAYGGNPLAKLAKSVLGKKQDPQTLANAWLAKNPAKAKILEDALKEYNASVGKYLDETIGGIPVEFVYEGKKYAPVEFLKENVPPQTMDMTLVIPAPIGRELETVFISKTQYPPSIVMDSEDLTWTSLEGVATKQEWSQIDAAIEKSLRQKPPKPVSFGIDIKDSLIDMDRGLMSIDAFAQYPGFLEEVQRMNAMNPGFTDGGHAIKITGIYRNTAGETIGYRIENSWGMVSSKTGKPIGDKGHFIMDVNYMRTFSPRLFFEKGMYELKPGQKLEKM